MKQARRAPKKSKKRLPLALRKDFKLVPKWVPRTPGLTDEDVATALFTVFHVECEQYDSTVCTGGQCADGSGRVPATLRETELVKRNTERLAALLLERAERLGLDRRALEVGDARAIGVPYDRVLNYYPKALSIIGGSFGRH